jgi:transposase
VKESYDIKPDVCSHCGYALAGKDVEPYRHQMTEIPPVVAEVTEYHLHTLTCSECGAETRAKLPTGVPQGAFCPCLESMVSLLGGRYHLSKRDTVDIMARFLPGQCEPGISARWSSAPAKLKPP